MDPLILAIIGLLTGLGGGLVGVGGSIIMIPLMVLTFGENQHLYQASAMICTVFVAISSLVAHLKAKSLVPQALKALIPTATAGVLIGVFLSNLEIFAGKNSYLLARIFGFYLAYAVIYNCFKFHRSIRGVDDEKIDPKTTHITTARCSILGIISGTAGGLLGIGAGSITTPMQQILMNMPIRRAMSNSTASIIVMATVGAIYKNYTLAQHNIEIVQSLKIAGWIIPGSLIGGYIGGYLMHKLPQNLIRGLFIIILLFAAIELLRVQPG